MDRHAMLPCAGLGLRMNDLTRELPKPLLPVQGIPLIAYSLFLLYEWKTDFCVLNLHYRGDQIIDYLEDFPFFPLHFSQEVDRILGTAGGIRQAMQSTPLTGHFLFMNPDTIFWPTRCPWHDLHENPGPDLFLYLSPKEPGNAERGFAGPEKQRLEQSFQPISMTDGAYYYSGLSILHTDAVQDIHPGDVGELRDTFQQCSERVEAKSGDRTNPRLYGRIFSGKRLDYGTAEQFEAMKSVDPVPASWKDRWDTFLDHWPGARQTT